MLDSPLVGSSSFRSSARRGRLRSLARSLVSLGCWLAGCCWWVSTNRLIVWPPNLAIAPGPPPETCVLLRELAQRQQVAEDAGGNIRCCWKHLSALCATLPRQSEVEGRGATKAQIRPKCVCAYSIWVVWLFVIYCMTKVYFFLFDAIRYNAHVYYTEGCTHLLLLDSSCTSRYIWL